MASERTHQRTHQRTTQQAAAVQSRDKDVCRRERGLPEEEPGEDRDESE